MKVYERDGELGRRSGYRLHVNSRACRALRQDLPPQLYQSLLASSIGGTSFRQMSFLDHRLRRLLVRPRDQQADAMMIGRAPLRRLLAHGLGDTLTSGVTFTHYVRHLGGSGCQGNDQHQS